MHITASHETFRFLKTHFLYKQYERHIKQKYINNNNEYLMRLLYRLLLQTFVRSIMKCLWIMRGYCVLQ